MSRFPAVAPALLVCLAAAPLPAQGSAESPFDAESAAARRAAAVRAPTPPVIDGRDDDPVWREAPSVGRFLEYEPRPGAETRFRTEARVVYDDRYLYVLVRMYDPAPDSIVSLLSRRDVRTQSEQVKLVIDSYHDRRTAYQFAVNPAGVKRDFYVYNDVVEDASWDAIWDVGTTVDSLGWTAEFRIPFSQLRFPRREEHTFGLMIVRDVARTNERISWPLYRRDRQGYVSQAGELRGIRGVPTPRRLEVTPYVVTSNRSEPAGNAFRRRHEVTGGADVKLGVTSNMTLDVTINPDFGQVEADPAVLNLGAFETFLGERRPFFLEGTGIFTFNVNCGDIDSGCTGLFYSRRIGRQPQLRPLYGDPASPTATTIIGAAKLTGRLAGGLSIGLLDAVTDREIGAEGRTIEPRANYLAARVQQDLRDGQSGIGAMVTAVNRLVDDGSAPWLRRKAYAGGVDLRHRFLQRRFELAAYIAGSLVAGSPEAIAITQRDPVHRFQRPDGAATFDPTRTSLAGDAQRISVSKFGGGITRFQTVYQRFSPGFEINDLGFLARADEQMLRNWFALQFNEPRGFYRRAFLNFNQGAMWTADGLPTGTNANFNGHIEHRSTWWSHFGITVGNFTKTFDDRVARGGPAVRRSPRWDVWAGVEGDRRREVTPVFFAGVFENDGGRSEGWWIDPTLQLRGSTRFNGSIGLSYEKRDAAAQWVDNRTIDGTTHHIFARLRQSTAGVTARLNYTASPTLSLQLYAQPFISVGTYSDWRELDDPRAERFEDRFMPYAGTGLPGGLDFKQFRSNAVLRWEYRPGSTLFAVWSQGRDHFEPVADSFSPRRDYDELFRLHPANTFLVKLSYWINP